MIKHILTIGLFDRESHKQEIEKSEAVKIAIETIFNHGFVLLFLAMVFMAYTRMMMVQE